jgi:hypothetical protein
MDLQTYPVNVQTLAQHARRVLGEWLPGAKETEDSSARMFAYAYGPGYPGMICTLLVSKSGVKLGIVGGASLPDPCNLLRGSGKVHRHVPLKVIEDLQQRGVKELVVAAHGACLQRMKQA